ncbi:MAG: hypothetical protein NUV78_01810 [Candidatus Zambryskibacteria bacterium]|nr:hypothetical protein [Candidatus Zambryskibacteria bacterium]
MNSKIFWIIILVIVIGAVAWLVKPERSIAPGNDGEAVFCTMDALQCSDGSWVGRTGPNCEFVCPSE